MALHLHLEHVVFQDLVALQVGQARVLYHDPCRQVRPDHVVQDQGRRVLLSQDPTRVVVEDLVVLDDALRVHQHHAVEVVVDDILIDQQLVLALHHEDALALRVLDHVVLDLDLARGLASQSDVGLDVGVYLVGVDGSVASLDYQDSLVVVVPDDVAVRERLQPKRPINIILEILHSNLIPKVLVVELWRLLLNRLDGRQGLRTQLRGSWGFLLEGSNVDRLPVRTYRDLFNLHGRCLGQFSDIVLGRATDVGLSVFHDLDATLAVVCDDIASDVRLAVRPEDDDSIEGTLLDLIPPDQGH